MIEKIYGKDFSSGGGALTLNLTEVTDLCVAEGVHTKTHKSGWTITGEVVEDYYVWVSEFCALHPVYGLVCGDFEETVYASSEKGFKDFFENHEPESWDYGDI